MVRYLNNPGNIRYRGNDKWQGAASPPQENGFCTFASPVYGIRAIARILITFQDKYGCRTVRDFISRWAPPADLNPTDQYIKNVESWGGFQPMHSLNAHAYADACALVEGIIRQEQGSMPYSEAQIDEALKLAGIVRDPPKSNTVAAAQSPAVIGGGALAIAATIQAIVAPIADVWDKINAMGIDPRIVIWGTSGAIAIAGGYMLIQWIKRRKQGLA